MNTTHMTLTTVRTQDFKNYQDVQSRPRKRPDRLPDSLASSMQVEKVRYQNLSKLSSNGKTGVTGLSMTQTKQVLSLPRQSEFSSKQDF